MSVKYSVSVSDKSKKDIMDVNAIQDVRHIKNIQDEKDFQGLEYLILKEHNIISPKL